MTKSDFTEYQIEYDVELGCFWVSGLTSDNYWIETDFVQVFDDPTEKVEDYVSDLERQGYHVDVFDITDDEDEWTGDEEEDD